MHYKSDIEIFKDHVDFDQNACCTWIVYPAGAAGDLVASIVNFHYARTGSRMFGITNTGQVIFRDSNKKEFNKNTWIMKPTDSFAGKGIKIFDNYNNFEKFNEFSFKIFLIIVFKNILSC